MVTNDLREVYRKKQFGSATKITLCVYGLDCRVSSYHHNDKPKDKNLDRGPQVCLGPFRTSFVKLCFMQKMQKHRLSPRIHVHLKRNLKKDKKVQFSQPLHRANTGSTVPLKLNSVAFIIKTIEHCILCISVLRSHITLQTHPMELAEESPHECT